MLDAALDMTQSPSFRPNFQLLFTSPSWETSSKDVLKPIFSLQRKVPNQEPYDTQMKNFLILDHSAIYLAQVFPHILARSSYTQIQPQSLKSYPKVATHRCDTPNQSIPRCPSSPTHPKQLYPLLF